MLTIAFSGGKDSTALALGLYARGYRGKPYFFDTPTAQLFYTPTGNELPGVKEHVLKVAEMTGFPFVRQSENFGPFGQPAGLSLVSQIHEQRMLPNWRARWCTRILKIEPAEAWMHEEAERTGEPVTLAVGLRADEESRAGGDWNPQVARAVYPLRDWGWGLSEVVNFCRSMKAEPPARTDCALCPLQTLHEWYRLWMDHPAMFVEGIALETEYGHTFRSPGRDTQPASLADLGAKFAAGYVPKERKRKVTCRICKAG